MPLASIGDSPLAGGPAEIYYREFGSGVPLLFLHGGWGYEIYPLDVRAQALAGLRVVIPARSGYGRSTRPAVFGPDLTSGRSRKPCCFSTPSASVNVFFGDTAMAR